MQICGIDYGSKMAGTTVLMALNPENGEIQYWNSEKKKDADQFLKETLNQLEAGPVFIDAPLSLPKVYQQDFQEISKSSSPNFFFREGDRKLKAMSPLFLGGLTARAMQLRYELPDLDFYETYPAEQARRMDLKDLEYKKSVQNIPPLIKALQAKFPAWKIPSLHSWHQVDALLALIGAWRFHHKKCLVYGNPAEGLIYV